MSQKYRVTAPDGTRFEITAPEGATEQQVLKYARQQFAQQQQQQPSTAAQATRRASPTPPPEMMAREQQAQRQRAAQAAAYSQARSPSGRMQRGIETEAGVFERARRAAEAAGVNPRNSAPAEGRLALALAAPVAQDPVQQAGVLENALGEGFEVRVGPETNAVEWKPSDQEQWSLANPPGFDLRDLAQAAPETGTLVVGAVGGVAGAGGGAAISGANPAVTGTSTIVGVGLGEGAATKARLELARERGYLPDLTDQQINDASVRRGLEASLFTAGGGVITKGARMVLARQLGASPELVRALSDVDSVDEAFKRAEELRTQAAAETGEELPLTAGQAAESPELQLAEQAARRRGPQDSALNDIQRQQQVVQNLLERRAFGDIATPEEQELLYQTFRNKAEADVEVYRDALEGSLDPVAARAAETPESAAAVARGQIQLGVRNLYENNFSPRYSAVFADSDNISVDLSGLRREAAQIRAEEGQDILRSINLTDQKILKEAQQAGLDLEERLVLGPDNVLEWQQELVSTPRTLSEVQNALVDIRRELRRPGIADEPRKRTILRRLETRLETIRNEALPPQKRAEVLELDRQYARASQEYDQSFIGQFIDLAPDGTPTVRTDLSFQRILRTPEVSQQFVDALSNLPNGEAALAQFRRGTVSYILDQSRDANGEISSAALNRFLSRSNRRALTTLFQGDDIADELANVSSAARALQERSKQVERATSYVNDLLNVRVTDASQIADLTYRNLDDLSVQEVNTARNLLPDAEKDIFDRSLATTIRDQLTDANGNVDFNKIDGFLEGRGSLVAKEIFGESYLSTLRTLRDVARVRAPVTREAAGRDINTQIASIFESAAGFADGMTRFLRVPFPPLSVRGRALTASLAQLQTRTQRQLAEALADPERFNDLRRLLSTDIKSATFDKIAAGAGLSSFVELKRAVEEAQRLAEQKEQDRQELGPAAISPTL